jgi:hypothetical protein
MVGLPGFLALWFLAVPGISLYNRAATQLTRKTTKAFPALAGDHFAASEKTGNRRPGLVPGRR